MLKIKWSSLVDPCYILRWQKATRIQFAANTHVLCILSVIQSWKIKFKFFWPDPNLFLKCGSATLKRKASSSWKLTLLSTKMFVYSVYSIQRNINTTYIKQKYLFYLSQILFRKITFIQLYLSISCQLIRVYEKFVLVFERKPLLTF